MQAMRAAAIMLMTVASFASAQQFPVKPIRVIVPYTPGGGNDFAIRTISQKLTESWGQQIIIENRAGAEGNLGTAYAARAAADGYTILHVDVGALCINPLLFSDVGFDTQKDFLPITMTTEQPYLVIVHPSVPAKTIKDLIAIAKANPGKLNFGSSGAPSQIAGEWIKHLAGIKMTNIPYKGAAPALIDVISGQIDLAFTTPAGPLAFIRSGRLRALGVTSRTRLDFLPDIPTVTESGIPDYEVTGWYGLFAPSGTPREVVARLNAEVARILRLPDVKERFSRAGMRPVGNSQDEFVSYMKSEVAKWRRAVEITGVKGGSL